jgi:hypothetical protein
MDAGRGDDLIPVGIAILIFITIRIGVCSASPPPGLLGGGDPEDAKHLPIRIEERRCSG